MLLSPRQSMRRSIKPVAQIPAYGTEVLGVASNPTGGADSRKMPR